MADVAETQTGPLAALLVEFETEEQLIEAARKTRDAGYTRFDAHSPYPVHGIDAAAGIVTTKLPWMVFFGGLMGLGAGAFLQIWTNSLDPTDFSWVPTFAQPYNYRISGKPELSFPAFVPVMFELTVLLSALTAVFGMLILNNLPWFYNALFTSKRFLRVTNDRFFISIPVNDPAWNDAKTTSFAESLGGVSERVYHAVTPGVPKWVRPATWILVALLCVPPAMVAKWRFSHSSEPRIRPLQDMGNQPRFKAQQVNPFFVDDRAMRPGPETPGLATFGTVAREDVVAPSHLTRGGRIVPDPNGGLRMEWFDSFPPEMSDLTLEDVQRGRRQFETYCALCHGYNGRGQGIIYQRALKLQAGWVQPTDLHSQTVRERPDGHIFNSISNGIRTMSAYGDQITPEDRWRIVAYVRSLQRSSSGVLADVPTELQSKIR